MLKLISPLTQVDSSAAFTVGTRTITKEGNEYIYLPGVASTAQYDWVTYRTGSGISYGSVTRLTAGLSGPVAIAQAAITNLKYGWFQIAGVAIGHAGAGFSSGSVCYASGTTGAVIKIGASINDIIVGSVALGTSSGASSGTGLVHIDHCWIPGSALGLGVT